MTLFININLYHPKGNNSGEISTVAADGTVTPFASGLSGPKAIAFAPDGTLYAVGIGEISAHPHANRANPDPVKARSDQRHVPKWCVV